MRVFSFGGGVQSMAALVLSAVGELDYTHFLMANVGNDSENPETIRYIHDVAIPYANNHGLSIIEVSRDRKPDKPQSLYQEIMQDSINIPIPIYLTGGGPGSRNCTSNWKIKVIEKWMKSNAGATKSNRQPLGVGISVDESHRMRTDDPEREPYVYKEYPLIDKMLTRRMCQDIISKAGLPLAPKSSCWFCPYKRRSEWITLRSTNPNLFAKAIEIEIVLNAKRQNAGKDTAYLTASGKPLDLAIPLATQNMFDSDDDDNLDFCESGYCMT